LSAAFDFERAVASPCIREGPMRDFDCSEKVLGLQVLHAA
jgi:hypothetical protein